MENLANDYAFHIRGGVTMICMVAIGTRTKVRYDDDIQSCECQSHYQLDWI